MKKSICILLSFVFCCFLVTASFADNAPIIVLQPQNYNYPEGSVAIYSVRAAGSNLKFTWYLDFQGNTYNLTAGAGTSQPWEAYAGSDYGQHDEANESTYHFSGIFKELDSAKIYCKVTSGKAVAESSKAHITVNGSAMPPIIEVPAELTVNKGDKTYIECKVIGMDPLLCSFQWYKTGTGELENLKALFDDTATDPNFLVDTSATGVFKFCCCVRTDQGAVAYSSIIPVEVLPQIISADPPQIITKSLPDAIVGEEYSAKIESTDKSAGISIFFNPGKQNDFESTGLSLKEDGTVSGKPSKAGKYTFSIVASGEGGEAYETYTLTVTENNPPATTSAETATTENSTSYSAVTTSSESEIQTTDPYENTSGTEAEQTDISSESEKATENAVSETNGQTEISEGKTSETSNENQNSMPVWAIILIILLAVIVLINTIIMAIAIKNKGNK